MIVGVRAEREDLPPAWCRAGPLRLAVRPRRSTLPVRPVSILLHQFVEWGWQFMVMATALCLPLSDDGDGEGGEG